MLEIAGPLLDALDGGRRLAVATVTRVLGSAPRPLGTSMAVDDRGAVIGSIAGGCVEGDVYEASRSVLAEGRSVLTEFGVTDDAAFAAGLSCGGSIEVFVTELAGTGERNAIDTGLRTELAAARRGDPAGLALVVDGPGAGTILPASVDARRVRIAGVEDQTAVGVLAELRRRLASGAAPSAAVSAPGAHALRVLYLVTAPPPRFLIFGAVEFAAALCDAATALGYRVTLCDARAVFTTPARFPSAAEVVVEWPADYLARTQVDERTVICVLTHDEKFDIPLLCRALRLDVGYVGAMGSRRTHERRAASLVRAGLGAAELGRLHSPIGLDLGASTPQETAVSILAEVLAARTGASGAPLRRLSGPIHAQAPTGSGLQQAPDPVA